MCPNLSSIHIGDKLMGTLEISVMVGLFVIIFSHFASLGGLGINH
jgi:hypothetical protein